MLIGFIRRAGSRWALPSTLLALGVLLAGNLPASIINTYTGYSATGLGQMTQYTTVLAPDADPSTTTGVVDVVNVGLDPYQFQTLTGTAGSDDDQFVFEFQLDNTYNVSMFTNGYSLGGYQTTSALYQGSPLLGGSVLLANDVSGGTPSGGGCGITPDPILVPAVGAALNVQPCLDSAILAYGDGNGYNFQGMLGPGTYFYVVTEYGNFNEAPSYSTANVGDGSAKYGEGNFTASTCPSGDSFLASGLDQNPCSQRSNTMVASILVTPEPQTPVLVGSGILLILLGVARRRIRA